MKRILKVALTLVCLVVFYAGLRVIFAERVDINRFRPGDDAERYMTLPYAGENYRAYALPGFIAGRTYLKGNVAAAIQAAYRNIADAHPEYVYLYGEMGWRGGGRFYPHRTHREGLSADFMTPVLKIDESSVGQKPSGTSPTRALPVGLTNGWGYYLRFEADGCYHHKGILKRETYCLDSAALITHLAALQETARQYGVRIDRVILDPPLLAILRRDPNFHEIRAIRFMEGRAWFPHDSHYHVDFQALN